MMNSFHDQTQRCIRHPHHRIVGVCACCLRERLTYFNEPITPADARDCEDLDADGLNISYPVQEQQLPPPPPPPPHQRFLPHSIIGTAEMAPHSHPNHEEALNLALQKVKNAHISADFVAHSPNQSIIHTGIQAAPVAASPHIPTTTQEKNRSPQVSYRRSNASDSDMKTHHLSTGNVDIVGKKRGSWFSMSKSKNSLLNSPMQQEGKKLSQDQLRSPQPMISAGRKSASEAVGSTCNNYRQTYRADLEAIAEINLGEAAIKFDNNNIIGDVSASSSWISSLFHRRKGPRSKSNLSNSSRSNNTATDEISAGIMLDGSINQSPKTSIDAGRLSWDGASRPNLKQILKKIEARKKQQRGDCSPRQVVDYAMKRYNDNGEDMTNQASSLQKCKSVASARSSISVEMSKDLMQASSSPMIHQGQHNVMVGLDYGNLDDDRILPRSRSWGRAWNRTLSPLWGFKQHGRKGANGSPTSSHHHHPGSVTPNHVNFKSHIGVPPPSSSYLSPLRRSKRASDARIHFAQ